MRSGGDADDASPSTEGIGEAIYVFQRLIGRNEGQRYKEREKRDSLVSLRPPLR